MTEFKQCTLQIEDLRCGNLVNYKGKPVRVDINVLQEIRGNNCDYTPIFLTPDVLDAAGFIDVGGTVHEEFEVEELAKGDFKIYCASFGKVNVEWRRIEIPNTKHLHQLMNLYHSLTGQKLKVNITA